MERSLISYTSAYACTVAFDCRIYILAQQESEARFTANTEDHTSALHARYLLQTKGRHRLARASSMFSRCHLVQISSHCSWDQRLASGWACVVQMGERRASEVVLLWRFGACTLAFANRT